MNGDQPKKPLEFEAQMGAIAAMTRSLAQAYQGDSINLLAMLRLLENLHQEIRDGLFQEALPENRQELYHLLREIDLSGGWPYIQRMRLEALLNRLRLDSSEEIDALLSALSQPWRSDSSVDY
jgi:hypothetical protein